MASYNLAPGPLQNTFFIPGGNTPGNGVQLFIYLAGSTTKQTVVKDNAGAASWSNPIVLDSGGNLPNGGVIWIPSGVSIKAVYAPSNDTDPPTSPYRTIDNISGVNDTTSSQSEWISGPTPTFVSGTQFTLAGDQTTTFIKGRRLKFTVTAGTVFGSVTSVSFAANTTTVNVAFDSGALDAGLTAVSYSVVSPTQSSISADYADKSVTSVATAGSGTTDIWGIAGNTVHLTGTNTVFSFSSAPYPGARRVVIADAAFTLKQNVSTMALPTAADISVAVGDRFEVVASTTANSVIGFYQTASGKPLIAGTASTGIAVSGDKIAINVSTMSNFLGGNVSLTSSGVYFAGPSVAQGSTGVWEYNGYVTVTDTGAAATFIVKLTDGTSVFASNSGRLVTNNTPLVIPICGIATNPVGNVAIQVQDATNATGAILSNSSGNSKDSALFAKRIG